MGDAHGHHLDGGRTRLHERARDATSLTTHLLVVRDGKSLVIDGFASQGASNCTVEAQITPSQ